MNAGAENQPIRGKCAIYMSYLEAPRGAIVIIILVRKGQIYAVSVQHLRNPDSIYFQTQLSFRLSQVAEPGGSLRGLNHER